MNGCKRIYYYLDNLILHFTSFDTTFFIECRSFKKTYRHLIPRQYIYLISIYFLYIMHSFLFFLILVLRRIFYIFFKRFFSFSSILLPPNFNSFSLADGDKSLNFRGEEANLCRHILLQATMQSVIDHKKW